MRSMAIDARRVKLRGFLPSIIRTVLLYKHHRVRYRVRRVRRLLTTRVACPTKFGEVFERKFVACFYVADTMGPAVADITSGRDGAWFQGSFSVRAVQVLCGFLRVAFPAYGARIRRLITLQPQRGDVMAGTVARTATGRAGGSGFMGACRQCPSLFFVAFNTPEHCRRIFTVRFHGVRMAVETN